MSKFCQDSAAQFAFREHPHRRTVDATDRMNVSAIHLSIGYTKGNTDTKIPAPDLVVGLVSIGILSLRRALIMKTSVWINGCPPDDRRKPRSCCPYDHPQANHWD